MPTQICMVIKIIDLFCMDSDNETESWAKLLGVTYFDFICNLTNNSSKFPVCTHISENTPTAVSVFRIQQ